MKTAVDAVFVGKERVFNRRFLIMADHYMVEPTACTPASGWEKGQVENQVSGPLRRGGGGRARPLLRAQPHPLRSLALPAGAGPQARLAPERRPFMDWELPPALAKLRRRLGSGDEADRRFVRVLPMVLTDGLEPVEAAVAEALAEGAASDDVVVNILARRREPERPEELETAPALTLVHAPSPTAPATTCCEATVQRHEMIAAMSELGLKGMASALDEAVTTGLQRKRRFFTLWRGLDAQREAVAAFQAQGVRSSSRL